MARIPGFQFNVSGASGTAAALVAKSAWRCFVLPRGAYAASDSTGTLITFDSADVISGFTVGDWVQSGLSVANIRQVGSIGGNSINVSGAALTVSENTRIFLIGSSEPTVTGGSATYTPRTTIRQRDDSAADVFTNSMITTNSDGLVQGFCGTGVYDVLVQDGNQTNQGSIIDMVVGVPEGISVSDWAHFGVTATFHANVGITGTLVVGATVTLTGGFSGTAIIPRLGPSSGPDSGGALRIIDGNVFPRTRAGVQAAVDDLPSAGGAVFLTAGIYTGWTTAVTLPDDTEVYGSGYATIIAKNTGSSAGIFMNSNANGSATGTTNNRIIVRDMKILGEGTAQTPYAIRMENVDIFRIENVWCQSVLNNDSAAIDIDSCSHFFVRGTYVAGCSNNAIKVRCSGRTSSDFLIANNVVDGTTAQNGIFVANGTTFAATRFAITGNVVKGVGDVGIEVGNNNAPQHNDFTITGNQVYGANGDGILVRTSVRGVVTGNQIDSGGSADSSGGIALLASAADCSDITISGNNVTGRTRGSGIRTGLASTFRCRRLNITGNECRGAAGAYSGIEFSGFGDLSVVSDNIVSDWPRIGIELAGSSSASRPIQRCSVIGNIVTGCSSHGIAASNPIDCKFIGNKSYNNFGYGLQISDTPSGNDNFHNDVWGNTSGSFNGLNQSLAGSTASLNLTNSLLWLSASTGVTLSSTPTIPPGYDGQRITLLNVGGVHAITLQDESAAAGTHLYLKSSPTTLVASKGNVELVFNVAIVSGGGWIAT